MMVMTAVGWAVGEYSHVIWPSHAPRFTYSSNYINAGHENTVAGGLELECRCAGAPGEWAN